MAAYYRAFGMLIQSDFAIASLPEVPAPADGEPDVFFTERPVEPCPDGEQVLDMLVRMDGARLLLDIEEVGRMSVEHGRITLQPLPEATEAQIATYLLGTGMGALLHIRRLLPFHSNAVVVGGRAFLFCGDSGAGKSTLAAYFVKHGLPLLTDDLCAIRELEEGQGYEGLPGIPRLKLWQQSIDLLDLNDLPRTTLPWSDDKFEILREDMPLQPSPIAAIYHLLQADESHPPGIHRLGTLEALNAITANIYRRRLADIAAGSYYLTMVAGLARLPTYAIRRRWGLEHFEAEARDIEAHLGR